MQTVIKKLPVKFTEPERDERAQKLAGFVVEIDEVEEHRRDRNKRFRDQLKDLRKKLRTATDAVRAGAEDRDVECRLFYNQPEPGTKQLVRSDTGEVVSEVAMTDAELQENLFKPGELEGLMGEGPQQDPPAQPEAGQ